MKISIIKHGQYERNINEMSKQTQQRKDVNCKEKNDRKKNIEKNCKQSKELSKNIHTNPFLLFLFTELYLWLALLSNRQQIVSFINNKNSIYYVFVNDKPKFGIFFTKKEIKITIKLKLKKWGSIRLLDNMRQVLRNLYQCLIKVIWYDIYN